MTEPFAVSGWSFFDGATSATGISAVHVQGCPVSNCTTQTFWGAATMGVARPDVAAYFNNPAGAYAGFTFSMAGLAPDTYHVEVWAQQASTTGWYLIGNLQIVVTSTPVHVIDAPTMSQAVAQPVAVVGWAVDAAEPSGTGVDVVDVWAYHNFGSGAPPTYLGVSTYGLSRSDVAAVLGARYLLPGYTFTMSGQPPGWYMFLVGAHSTTAGTWTVRTVNAYVDIPTSSLTITRSGTGTGAVVATGLSCPGGAGTQGVPCSASYTTGSVVTFTAVPDAGSTFAGWAGGLSGTNPVSAMTLAGDRYAYAEFVQTPATVATTYYHTDVVGSVRAITDASGATVTRHDYFPFGEDTQPLTGDPMRFGGKEQDPESALLNFEARYYRNTWGRFTQVDPIGGAPGDTQSWNRYAYARNNPLKYIDPTGLSARWSQRKEDPPPPKTQPIDIEICKGPPSRQAIGCGTGSTSGGGQATAAGALVLSLETANPYVVAAVAAVVATYTVITAVKAIVGWFKTEAKPIDPSDGYDGREIRQEWQDLEKGDNQRVVPKGEAEEVYKRWAQGGEDVTPAGLEAKGGKMVRLPDGTTVTWRPESKSTGPAVDVRQPGRPNPMRVHEK